MIKLSDYIFRFLADNGVDQIFLITGGGAMHLNDSIRKETRISYICHHHEQACAMAAEGYSRITGKMGVINVTTGPGGINAMNGVFGAWTDSIPMMVISGQVKRETCSFLYPEPLLRQLGDQEADIIRLVKGITKYAAVVEKPETIRFHLEKALHLATSGRPGPVWLDIPMDIQASLIEEGTLEPYKPENADGIDDRKLEDTVETVLETIRKSRRPVIMPGTGVHLAHAQDIFDKVINLLGIPVATAWTAPDVISSDDPLFCGRTGTIGDRAGNFTVQNSDTLLVLGSRLNIRQVSYNWQSFARKAYKIQIDIDPLELNKPTVKPDLAICCDLNRFLCEVDRQLAKKGWDDKAYTEWLEWCRERVKRYPVVLERHRKPGKPINPYYFIEQLFDRLGPDDVVVCGNGSASVVTYQAARIRKGQRIFANSGCASMGYDLPSAIGAAVALKGGRVICLAGDGSIQMNIQELQTVVHNRLPVKIFVLNNNGYLSIRSSQQAFFEGFIGESPESGVSFPDIVKVAEAYGIRSARIDDQCCGDAIEELLTADGPCVCDVVLDPEQPFEPKLSSKQLPDGRIVSAPLEDLYPFLGREELLGNLLIEPMSY